MKIVLDLTKAEMQAILRSQGLGNGCGVRKAKALASADAKLRAALEEAVQGDTQSRGAGAP